MFVIYDNRKLVYMKDIKRHLVSGKCETMGTMMPKRAFKFKDKDRERLAHFEKLLKYQDGELEYREA